MKVVKDHTGPEFIDLKVELRLRLRLEIIVICNCIHEA